MNLVPRKPKKGSPVSPTLTEMDRFLSSRYIPGNGTHHRLGKRKVKAKK